MKKQSHHSDMGMRFMSIETRDDRYNEEDNVDSNVDTSWSAAGDDHDESSRRPPSHHWRIFMFLFIRKWKRFILVVATSAALLAIALLRTSPLGGETLILDEIPWNDLQRNDTPTCRKTTIYPFHVGCPADCLTLRPELVMHDRPKDMGDSNSSTQSPLFYRTDLVYYFGQSTRYSLQTGMPKEPSFYKQGMNFQCRDDLVRHFVQNAQQYVAWAQKQTIASVNLQAVMVRKLHVSLAYICCLTAQETFHARQVMWEWIMERQQSNPRVWDLVFDSVDCWHVRPDTIGIALVADNRTQQTLLEQNLQISQRLQASGIPIFIPRLDQMRFHMSLAVLQSTEKSTTSSSQQQTTPPPTIDPFVSEIASLTKNISNKMGNTWTGSNPQNVAHWPRPTGGPDDTSC